MKPGRRGSRLLREPNACSEIYPPEASIRRCSSGVIGMRRNALTLAPPVLPCGTRSTKIFVAAPIIRTA
jgi:hypothetical protein